MNKETASLLEHHFDTAFAAPDGIKKLRELILTLAMQGKLVEQNSNDQPASELLKKIEAEKKRLVKEGKIKKPKVLPEIKPEEVPYELLYGWEWVRLGNIGEINPRNNVKDDLEAGFVPMPLVFSGYGVKHQLESRKWGDIKKGYTHFANHDVGLAKITPCFENAKSCVFLDLPNGIGAGTTELHIFRNSFGAIYPEYLLAYLKNPRYIAAGTRKMTGSAGQKRVPKDFFAQNPFPLPPLPEQHRIVTKIDQLMARCDELEKLRTQREQMRLSVHTAAIKQLLDADEQDGHTHAWQFITQHFGELYTVKENVTELRKAILQLAVMGKLVPQNPNDPPASELLKEIKTEKQRLVKEGLYRSNKDRESDEVKCRLELPSQWQWTTIKHLGFLLGGKRLPKGHTYSETPTSYRYLTVTNMKGGTIVDNNIKYIDQKTHNELKKYIISKNDLYITIAGTIGVVGSIPEHCDGMNLTENASRLVFFKCDKTFLFYLLISGVVQEQFETLTNKMAQPKLSLRSILSAGIPLPPLPEQHRIVTKIDQLMTLCDTLEQQIVAATGKQNEMLNAVIAQV